MTRRPLKAIAALALIVCAGLHADSALAQTQSGAVAGTVRDQTNAPLAGVTVTISGPSLQGQQTEFTDATGQYTISGLPPGSYSALFIYDQAQLRRENIDVALGKATPVNVKMDLSAAGEVITIKERPPAIDGGSTKIGLSFDTKSIKNLPYQGRTFQGLLDSTPGSQTDLFGEGFSGSQSVENAY